MEFRFTALSPQNKKVSGKVNAISEREVRAKLQAKGYKPIKVSSATGSSALQQLFAPKVTSKEMQFFLRQLSVMLNAGVPLLESLQSLTESSKSKALPSVLKKVIQDIQDGRNFSEALKEHPKVFIPMLTNLVRAGEEGGVLDEVLSRLALYFEKREKLKSKVKGALMYPIVTVVVAFASVAAILILVVPKFQSIFKSNGAELPEITQFVVGLSEFFQANWIAILAVGFGAPILLVWLYNRRVIKASVDQMIIRIPVFGSLVKRGGIARMCRTLAILLKSGIRINDGIDITKDALDHVVFEGHLNNIKDDIISGRSFSLPVEQSKFFPKIVVQMIKTGEKTGNLDGMLEKLADFYEEEVETTADQLTTLLEPMIIVFLGGIIGFLVLSIFMPIFSMGNAFV